MFIYLPRLINLISKYFLISGITIFPFIFTSRPYKDLSFRFKNHELIHIQQQLEFISLGLVLLGLALVFNFPIYLPVAFTLFGYYATYGLFFLINKLLGKDSFDAYYDIPFEREAYENQNLIYYLDTRLAFAWVSYLLR
jgi:hypothetical protein